MLCLLCTAVSNLDIFDTIPCVVTARVDFYTTLALPLTVALVFGVLYGSAYRWRWRPYWCVRATLWWPRL